MEGKVVVNLRCLARPTSGVERYTRELARRLGERLRPVAPPAGRQGLSGHIWEQARLPGLLGEGELLWSPANSGPLRLACQVVTIHDLAPLDHPEWYGARFAAWYGFLLPRLARRARRVITVSEFSRRRILEACGLPPERVVAIYPGVDRRFFRPVPTGKRAQVLGRRGIEGPYLLAAGRLRGRKNLATLLEAWEAVHRRRQALQLVVIGEAGAPFREAGRARLARGVRFLGRVPDEELPALYGGALAFLCPSTYEGFGLCALEAMACGTPVIAADAAGLPEAVGEAGLLVKASDVGELAAVIEAVVEDGGMRARLARRGRARARSFSWERAAAETWQALEQARLQG